MNIPYLLFSTQGRIGRGQWWLGIAVIIGFAIVAGLSLYSIFGTALFYTFSGRMIVFIVTAISLAANYGLNTKRFHDRGKPDMFAQIALGLAGLKAVLDLTGLTGDPVNPSTIDNIFQFAILGVGIWYFIELGCMRGTTGANEYGPDPLSPARASS